jgi:hypothetical protein
MFENADGKMNESIRRNGSVSFGVKKKSMSH